MEAFVFSGLTTVPDVPDERILSSPLGPDKTIPSAGFAVTLFNGLQRVPNSTALVDVFAGSSITFGKFRSDVELAARHLLRLGCRRGDVVAIFSPNSFAWMTVAAATIRIGAVLAAVNHLLTPAELRYQLTLCGAKFIYTVTSLATVAMEAAVDSDIQTIIVNGESVPENTVPWAELQDADADLPDLPDTNKLGVRVDDAAMILFSSGTTGPQKAVMLSHRNIHTQLVISCDRRVRKVRHNEVMFAPFAHIKGCLFTLYNLAVGFTTYIMTRFSFRTYLQLVAHNKLDCLSVVPAIAIQLAKSPDVDDYDLSCVREIVCGTAPLRREVENILLRRFPGVTFRQAYGLTETSSIVTNIPDGLDAEFVKSKSGSVGVPLYNVQMKVIDLKTGQPVGADVDGEICVKSPLVMLGYAGNPQATAAAIDAEGWLHTGDVGHYDADHFLYIVDRIKELIKYKSYQVAPAELESVLLGHPDVADAGVAGLPDEATGELPVALVVRCAGSEVTEADLQKYVAARVAPYKRLHGGVRFVSAVPRSPSGKILRRQMRDMVMQSRL